MLFTNNKYIASTDVMELRAFAESLKLGYIHMYESEEGVPFFALRPPSFARKVIRATHDNPKRKNYDFTVYHVTNTFMKAFKKGKKHNSIRMILHLSKLFKTELPWDIFYDTFQEVPKKDIKLIRDNVRNTTMKYTNPKGLDTYVLAFKKSGEVDSYFETIEGEIFNQPIEEKWVEELKSRMVVENHLLL